MNILKVETRSHEANTTTDTSVSSDLRLAKRMKPTVSPTATTTTKYKGVVQQQNGHWGAQIYADHKRIWLGTFKSAAEAAAAYDSASIKLRSFDANSHRNFPWSEITVHEPDFQKNHTTEAVLNMIRDNTYLKKFSDYLEVRSQMVAIVGSKHSRGGGGGVQEPTKRFSCTELFHKELTPSDVGKLNRLVIPKKHAVKHLPFITEEREVIPKKHAVKHLPSITEEREEGETTGGGGAVDDVEVVFYDRAMRQWKFRYCYWKSSQSFVFTRGWNGFVKEKNLKEKDVIVFYTCDVPSNFKTLEGQSNNFLMIDVDYFTEKGSVDPKEVNKMVRNVSEGEMKTENFFSSKFEEEAKPEVNKGGFMLFGVRIIQ